jgi:hypothetical protein
MKTKVYSIEVGDNTVHLFWDNASALDFATALGIEDVNEVQIKMVEVLAELNPGEDGSIKISSIDAMAKMIYVAIQTGHEHKEEPLSVNLRWVRNTMLGQDATTLIEAFAGVIAQYMPEVDESKKKATQKEGK